MFNLRQQTCQSTRVCWQTCFVWPNPKHWSLDFWSRIFQGWKFQETYFIQKQHLKCSPWIMIITLYKLYHIYENALDLSENELDFLDHRVQVGGGRITKVGQWVGTGPRHQHLDWTILYKVYHIIQNRYEVYHVIQYKVHNIIDTGQWIGTGPEAF